MKYLAGLALVLSVCLGSPAFAMTDESSHFNQSAPQNNVADPDEKTGFDSLAQGAQGQMSGREQSLIGNSDSERTYGTGGGSMLYGGDSQTSYFGAFGSSRR